MKPHPKINYTGLWWILGISFAVMLVSFPINFYYSEELAGDIQTADVILTFLAVLYWAGWPGH